MNIKYELKVKLVHQEKAKTIFEEISIEDVEETTDIDELITERLEDRFNTYCSCINESQTYCDCDPIVESMEIEDRFIII